MNKVLNSALAAGVLVLTACGAGADDLKHAPVEELTEQAARGDAEEMQELERRATLAATAEVGQADAGDAEAEWQSAMMSGDHEKLDALVEAGNVYAQTHAASIIGANPAATEEEKASARTLLEAAAEAGHGPALYRMSEDHLGPSELYPTDEAKALALGIRAAEAGDHEGMYKTGIRYQYGLATAPQDNALATEWLEKAKAAGNRDAQRQLDELAANSG